MFDKILIANRGEIALRVVRACREMGIKTVAVYSQADEESLHVQLADQAICIGSPASSDSYLKIDRLISAAEIGDVDAIHPGYGFLAENAHFAEVCASCNIRFIGPPANAIRTMGDKNAARDAARKAGVPITPGSDGVVETEAEALRVAKKIGYPVMIKASAGGGGRGMRAAHNDVSLVQGFHAARQEAEKAFGKADVYFEKLIVNPRHIEFQIVADAHGRVIHLGRARLLHPAPQPEDRRGSALAVPGRQAAPADGQGVGQARRGRRLPERRHDGVPRRRKGHFYFMEMNTRIQVEHCVTEEVYGCDLVKEQIRIAAGEPLSEHIAKATIRQHAIECRINAENPAMNFQPCPGRIELYYAPGGRGIRVDSHAYAGYVIPPHYDSLIGKLITAGSTRASAVARMSRALGEYMITGIQTTIPFQQEIMRNADFVRGSYHTGFVAAMRG